MAAARTWTWWPRARPRRTSRARPRPRSRPGPRPGAPGGSRTAGYCRRAPRIPRRWSGTGWLPVRPPSQAAEQRLAVRPGEPAGVADQVVVVGEIGIVRRAHHAGEVLHLRQRVLEVDDREQPAHGGKLGPGER